MGDDLVLSGVLFVCLWELNLALFIVNNRHICIFWRTLIPEAVLLKHCTIDTIMKKQKSCSHAVYLLSVFTEVIRVKCPAWVPVFQPSQVFQNTFPLGRNGGLVELFPADRSALSFRTCRRNPVSLYSVLLYGRSDCGICGLDAI